MEQYRLAEAAVGTYRRNRACPPVRARQAAATSHRSRMFPIHSDLYLVLTTLPRIDAFVFHGPRKGRLKPDTVRNVLIDSVLEPLATKLPFNRRWKRI